MVRATTDLIQRFQLLVWPDTDPNWEYVDRRPDAAIEERLTRTFQTLVDLESANPFQFRFDADAQELFIDWLTDLEGKLRSSELHPALISHLSKYREPDADPGGSLPPGGIGGGQRRCRYRFPSPHATSGGVVRVPRISRAAGLLLYRDSAASGGAANWLDRIKARKVGADGFFSCRDVYLKGWSGLDTPEAVKLAAEVLHDAGWVREKTGESGPSGGRPSSRYEVNPRVWQ